MELAHYDEAIKQLSLANKVDEVAEMRNQAMAMETYARLAMNLDAERHAVEIRIRAERKAGQLLSCMERNQGVRNDITSVDAAPKLSEFKQAKTDSGISDDQGKRWQKLASIPDDEFETSIKKKEMPTTTGVIRESIKIEEPVNPISTEAVSLWGSFRMFEDRINMSDISYLLEELTDGMRKDVFLGAESVINMCEAILNEKL